MAPGQQYGVPRLVRHRAVLNKKELVAGGDGPLMKVEILQHSETRVESAESLVDRSQYNETDCWLEQV